jgi:CubicO group peptidase (beta-lactamase class C family)
MIFRLAGFLSIVVFLTAAIPGIGRLDVPAASSGSLDTAALDDAITAQMHKHGLRGIALAVTQADQVIYQKGYGEAGANRPMTPQTPMYIGSQSKSITALAVAQLAEQGKIDLSAPVQKYIPWFAVADPQASRQITIFHLLHHTSGLSDAGYTALVPENASLEEGVRALASARLTAPMGTKFQYFNMGYCVLMLVIEKASGQTFAGYIQQHIFAPLHMTRTFSDPAAARAAGLAQGYSRFFGFTVPAAQPHLAYQSGDGYLISTAEDMARFAIAMNNQATYQGARVLSPGMLQKVFSPVMGYGMGWFIGPDHIYHGGANETFKTFVDLYPSRKLGIVLLINQGYMMDHYISAGQVFSDVEAIVLGKQPPGVGQGIAVPWIGWGLLALVLGLCALHTNNILHLRGWRERVMRMSPPRRAFDVAISFLIPTVILLVVYSQVKAFFGDRLNLTYQLVVMFRTLPDIAILMLVGSVPDYVQGVVKVVMLVRGKSPTA